jgi:hypothetical protein
MGSEQIVTGVLGNVRQHLAGSRTQISTADLLGTYAEQLCPIYFRPWWDELSPLYASGDK